MKNFNSYKVGYSSPSNIALIKYWGKFDIQLPKNPSISMTLKNCKTNTIVQFDKSIGNGPQVSLTFEGHNNTKFEDKIVVFLKSLVSQFPWLKDYILTIESENTFPHSSGIASSASSMSALAMCLVDFDCKLQEREFDCNLASSIARLGSGSASRSVFPEFALWGECHVDKSTNLNAIQYDNFDKSYLSLQDAVLIVSKEEKAVSSRAGHALMNNHPFNQVRYANANKNLVELLGSMNSPRSLDFIDIVEKEALELHGLMMNSNPSFILMKPNTLSIIECIRNFRKETGTQVFFTLDAGPNVHVLYYKEDERRVKDFINTVLLQYTHNNTVIFDEVGKGPMKLNLD